MDVDGVLLAFGEPSIGLVTSEHHAPMHSSYLWYDKRNIPRLRKLRQHFDIHWATGWGDDANKYVGPPHQLPILPVVSLARLTLHDLKEVANVWHWKSSAIEEYVGDRPFAFVDDDIGELGLLWAKKRNETIPTKLVPVKAHIGLTDEIVDELVEWANEEA